MSSPSDHAATASLPSCSTAARYEPPLVLIHFFASLPLFSMSALSSFFEGGDSTIGMSVNSSLCAVSQARAFLQVPQPS